jgi:regulator of sigma E protease
MTVPFLSLETIFVLPVAVFAFVCLLTIIVFFHEFGHFSVARLFGIRVEVFAIGFGRPLARWRDKHGTEWRISMLPFGGYVKFFGDAGPASNPNNETQQELANISAASTEATQFPRPGQEEQLASQLTAEERAVCFHFKPLWNRAAVVAAGPIANFILAVAIFWVLLMTFGKVVGEPRVSAVMESSAAAEAGFEPGDLIRSVNGRDVETFDDLRLITSLSAGEQLEIIVDRNGEELVLQATPRRQVVKDGFGNDAEAGVLGLSASADSFHFVRFGPMGAFRTACAQVWEIVSVTAKFLGRLVLGKESAKQLGGPIKMAKYAGQSAMSGFDVDNQQTRPSLLDQLKVSLANFINLAAFVSVSIGFLNLLPIPVLDGGHLMYYAYEAAAGKPLSVRAQNIGFRVGIVLLASFMIFVTWNDISNLFSVNS